MVEKNKYNINITGGEIVIYQTEDGQTKIDVKFEDETVWLTQAQLCELYQTSKSNISEHIKHIFEEGELDENSVVRNFRTTAADGKNYNTIHYNLDMIISLGYRVKSKIATNFRRWATERLKEYMIKGFTMDDERMKKLGGGNYWKEYEIYVRPKRLCIVKCLICMRQVLIIILKAVNPLHFLKWCKISCTMQHMGIRQQK